VWLKQRSPSPRPCLSSLHQQKSNPDFGVWGVWSCRKTFTYSTSILQRTEQQLEAYGGQEECVTIRRSSGNFEDAILSDGKRMSGGKAVRTRSCCTLKGCPFEPIYGWDGMAVASHLVNAGLTVPC